VLRGTSQTRQTRRRPQRECVECGAVYSTLEAAGWWQPDVPANPEASGALWQAGTGDSAARSRATRGRRADRSGAAWVQRARAGTRETLLGVVCDVRC